MSKQDEEEFGIGEIDARLSGRRWFKYHEIPESMKAAYVIILDGSLVGLTSQLQKTPCAFGSACEYWYNNQLYRIADKISEVRT